MDHNKSTLERAFEIAKAGKCQSVADVRECLRTEGYDQRQLEGRELAKQIQELIKRARAGV